MTYADLIKQWFNRSATERDPFTKYIFLYISFIALLSQRRIKTSDRERINIVKEDSKAKVYYLNLIKERTELRDTLSRLVAELRHQPIPNLTRINDENWRGTEGVLDREEDWENLVEFWYRVRNNLFHGHKALEFGRDKRLVDYACKTLQPFMQNFINHDLLWEFD